MARIRTIKPIFFRSRSVKQLNDKQKLVWIGLWPLSDDEGRLMDEPGILTGDLWALSLSEPKLDKILAELHEAGKIVRYKVAGQAYIQVLNWHTHQKINRPYPSTIPPVPSGDDSVNAHASLTPGKEGNGKEQGSARESSRNAILIPADFSITPAMRKWAIETIPAVNITRETDDFIDYWRNGNGKGKTKKSWDQTWRTWMRKKQTDAEGRGWAPPKPSVDAWMNR